MKKLFTLLILLGGVVLAQAADLTINGYTIPGSSTSINAGQSKGTISYNVSSSGACSLTFNGVTMNTGNNAILKWESAKSLTIYFKGENTLTCSHYGIQSLNGAVINFEGADYVGDPCGKLTLKTTGTDYSAISLKGGTSAAPSKLTMRRLFFNIEGVEWCIAGDNGDLDGATARFVECKGTIKVSGGSNGAMCRFKDITFDSRDGFLESGAFVAAQHSICESSSSTTKKKEINVGTSIIVGDVIVGIGYNDMSVKPTGLTKGTITFPKSSTSSSQSLILDNIEWDCPQNSYATNRGICVAGKYISDFTIELKGSSSISKSNASGSGSVIFASENQSLTIKGSSGSSTADGLSVLKCNWCINKSYGGNLTIKDCTLLLSCNGAGIKGNNSKLTLSGVTAAIVGVADGSIDGFSSCDMGNVYVDTNLSPGICYRSALKGFGTFDAITKEAVWMQVPSTRYDIVVCGVTVTNANNKDIQVDGLTSGKISWDNDTKTLTLNNATIAGPAVSGTVKDTDNTLCLGVEGLTVNVIGDNSISAASAKQTGLYIKADNVTISGTGNLSVTSTGSGAYGAQVASPSHKLTIHSMGRVEFIGDTYGLAVGKLVLKKDAGGKIRHYRFKSSATGAALWVKELTLDNVDFYSGNSLDEPTLHGCYWDPDASNMILQNGGSIARGLVAFRVINEKYNLYVGNTQVTDCNAAGIGSKYIKAGGPTAVTFKDNTLTLNGVTLDVGSDFVNAIRNTNDGLTIKVTGTNVLTSSHSGYNSDNVPINVSANTTITGDGSLKVEKLPVSTYSNANLTLKDAKNLEFHNIKANTSSSTSKLLVDNSNVTINNSTSYFANVSWQNGFLHLPKDGYFDSEIRKIVDSYGNAATKVVFGDKTTAGIDGITTDADAEVIGIYDAQGRKLEEMQQGINIIRMSDGTTKKIIKK